MSAINFVDYFFRKINGVKRVSFDANLERQSGEGTYLFANGLPIGMATVGDCQGVKMEFDYGVAPSAASIAGNGKMAHGLNIKMTMDQDWDFDLKPYNGTVRCATLQAVSENDVSGRLEGAYINAQATGDYEIEGYISGLTGPGIIGIEARTELASSATITTPSAVGVLIFHQCKASAVLTGFYRALQIEMPLMGSAASISTTTCAIYVGNDWGGADTFDYGLYIKSGTSTNGIYVATADAAGSGSGIYSLTTLTSTAAAAHRAVSGTVTYTPATVGSGGSVPIGVAGKVTLSAGCTSTLYMWGVQGQLDFANTAVLDGSQVAAVRAVMTNTGSQTWTGGNIAGIYVDNLIDDDITGVDSNIMRLANHGGGIDAMISFYCAAHTVNMFRFEDNMGIFTDITGGGVHGGTIQRIKCEFAGTTYYMLMSTAPTS